MGFPGGQCGRIARICARTCVLHIISNEIEENIEMTKTKFFPNTEGYVYIVYIYAYDTRTF